MRALMLCLLVVGCSADRDCADFRPREVGSDAWYLACVGEPRPRAMIVTSPENSAIDHNIDEELGPGNATKYYVFPPEPPTETYVSIDWSTAPCAERNLIEYRVNGREILRVDIHGGVYRNGKRWGVVEVPPRESECPEVTK